MGVSSEELRCVGGENNSMVALAEYEHLNKHWCRLGAACKTLAALKLVCRYDRAHNQGLVTRCCVIIWLAGSIQGAVEDRDVQLKRRGGLVCEGAEIEVRERIISVVLVMTTWLRWSLSKNNICLSLVY